MDMSNLTQIMNNSIDLNNTNSSMETWSWNGSYLIPPKTEHLTRVIITIQIVVGLIGNSISLIVWTKGKECSKLACSTYFQLLAIWDIFAFISPFCSYVLDLPDAEYDAEMYAAKCIGMNFLYLFTPQISIWLVVCLSIERLLSLKFPFSFAPNGAKFRAKIAMLALAIVMTAVNGHVYFLCTFSEISDSVYVRWFELSTVWALSFIPMFLILTSNILILVHMCLLNRRSKVLSKTKNAQRVTMFTKLTLASSLLLFISLTPTLFVTLQWIYNIFSIDSDAYTLAEEIVKNTMNINNCLNFLVYCLSSATFRSDLKLLVQSIYTRN